MDRDLHLVKALKLSSRSAFDRIYQRYADKVYRVSRRMYLPDYEAQEMVQKVFMTLWERRAELKEQASLNAYLLTITRNNIINFQKKKVAELCRNSAWQNAQPSYCNSPEKELLYQDMERHTLQFIETLPVRNKQIYQLSRRKGFSNQEIAYRLRLSQRTVENNIYRAEKAIYQFLHKSRLIVPSLSAGLLLTF